ncbi:WD40-repeat-containing domain protein [Aspergillus minisclerotigenes]|uniref:WD40-repeat-containing domain protein n=1 Tax=Aspergillus minisclerotigenes TaxID=656917 RepID=A0A5N6J4S7_9EURO|nr:WD40-repeat-containing domain protein [Aspergillus minisclerotigenes]
MRWIQISPDGGNIALKDKDYQVLNWNLSSGERSQTISAPKIHWLRFSPNREKIALITYDHQSLLWNLSNRGRLQPLTAHRNWIRVATFSPDEDKFASLSDDSMLRICDVSTGHCLQALQVVVSDEYHGAYAITFCPQGLYVASSSGETAQFWDVCTGHCLQTLKGHSTAISEMAGYWCLHQVLP